VSLDRRDVLAADLDADPLDLRQVPGKGVGQRVDRGGLARGAARVLLDERIVEVQDGCPVGDSNPQKPGPRGEGPDAPQLRPLDEGPHDLLGLREVCLPLRDQALFRDEEPLVGIGEEERHLLPLTPGCGLLGIGRKEGVREGPDEKGQEPAADEHGGKNEEQPEGLFLLPRLEFFGASLSLACHGHSIPPARP